LVFCNYDLCVKIFFVIHHDVMSKVVKIQQQITTKNIHTGYFLYVLKYGNTTNNNEQLQIISDEIVDETIIEKRKLNEK